MPSTPRPPTDDKAGRLSLATVVPIAFALVVVQVLGLMALGQPPICPCGQVKIWGGLIASPDYSQHLTDWHSYSHLVHGIGFYLLLWLIAPRMPVRYRFLLAVGIEAGWEVFENTPLIIERYRQSALARDYAGDSIINSVSDTVAMMIGFGLARVLPVWATVALVIGAEAFTAVMIRDNLLLNIIQLIYPNEFVSRWQAGG